MDGRSLRTAGSRKTLRETGLVSKSVVWDSGDAYEPYVGRWSRRVAPAFLDWAEIPAGRVLDVGCGTGALSQALIDRGVRQVVGLDPSRSYVRHAMAHVKNAAAWTFFLVGNAMALSFASETFDGLVSGLVLNFVPQP